jgi:hypothetical protein
MNTLEKSLRNQLERTVKEARDVAEAAAQAALEQLGVGEGSPPGYLSPEQRKLRRELRTHGHQLGDSRDEKKGTQQVDRLMEEVAYEHWHRMLFARFLAENNLLMYFEPDSADQPVAVSLEECEDLAAEQNARNGWELAARFAGRMLPRIFRTDSPLFELQLPPDRQQRLEKLVAQLPSEVFLASDSLGWVYQFWQSKRKDEVNDSEVKIGAREIPAVTQLFTEAYMVSFLLDNTLGAWWAAQRLTQSDLAGANDESSLRAKAALPGMALEYLRLAKDENGTWKIAAGTFPGWPKKASQLKVLDPSCGSGHFLVAALPMLVAIRHEAEGLPLAQAVEDVLRDNLYGLEIDARCTQIAAFNLALAAWRMAGYRRQLTLQIACTGISVGGTRDQWMKILEGKGNSGLRFHFGQLYDLFSKASTLGSLINPNRYLGSGTLDEKARESLTSALTAAIAEEPDPASELHEMGVAAQGVAKAAELLGNRYTLVVTNVPYLGRGRQEEVLKEHLEQQYPLGKSDLATAFVLRCMEFCAEGGSSALVTPQNWLFLTTYTNLRETLLERREWNFVARLGAGAFETIGGHVVKVALLALSARTPDRVHLIAGVDVSTANKPEEKAGMLRGEVAVPVVMLKQEIQLNNPDSVITLTESDDSPRLSVYADAYQGSGLGDIERYRFLFWEHDKFAQCWDLHVSSPIHGHDFSGMHFICKRRHPDGSRDESPLISIRGRQAWGRQGVAIAWLGSLPASRYLGSMYDNSATAIIPRDERLLPAIYAFCKSPEFNKEVRKINQKMQVANATMVQVPFDVVRWERVAREAYPNGLPEPESDDPTQWLFHGRPEESTSPLQVAVARLLGYRWPAELDTKMRLSERARRLTSSCDSLASLADKDGIVCIPPVRGEPAATDRLLNLLVKAYGSSWSNDVLTRLLKEAGFPGKSLETWLRDGFFTQHCELFHHCPFIWQIWDGLRDGFSVLVNYHKLDRKNLETLIYTYLGDWITRQTQDRASGVDGAEEKMAAAEQLKKRLELILEGESPYDIFVRWKPIVKQPIGWAPDLNDGVRINIRPFVLVPDVKAKGTGVLRAKPKVAEWAKDRGKDPDRQKADFPWSWGWDGSEDFEGGAVFTGERVNDCHYTIPFKQRRKQAN